ncbi:hypothetical protein C4K16_3045 [Pseudomonas chlororaphis subsp. aurantiaca]|nr:hypothetical protein C4K16_3045 [Pseudomonas chlororaphis subsp. aurantiaca]
MADDSRPQEPAEAKRCGAAGAFNAVGRDNGRQVAGGLERQVLPQVDAVFVQSFFDGINDHSGRPRDKKALRVETAQPCSNSLTCSCLLIGEPSLAIRPRRWGA